MGVETSYVLQKIRQICKAEMIALQTNANGCIVQIKNKEKRDAQAEDLEMESQNVKITPVQSNFPC